MSDDQRRPESNGQGGNQAGGPANPPGVGDDQQLETAPTHAMSQGQVPPPSQGQVPPSQGPVPPPLTPPQAQQSGWGQQTPPVQPPAQPLTPPHGQPAGWGQQPPTQPHSGGQPQAQQAWGQQPPGQTGWGQQPPGQPHSGGQPQAQQAWGQQPPGQTGWGQQPQGQTGWGQPPQGQQAGWGQHPQGQQAWGQQPQGQTGWGQHPQGQQAWGQQPQGQTGWGQQPHGQQGFQGSTGASGPLASKKTIAIAGGSAVVLLVAIGAGAILFSGKEAKSDCTSSSCTLTMTGTGSQVDLKVGETKKVIKQQGIDGDKAKFTVDGSEQSCKAGQSLSASGLKFTCQEVSGKTLKVVVRN